jgi:acetate---CoA ligase (ADP-forming) subunit beta
MGTDQLIRQVREAKRTLLTEVEAKDILKEAGIAIVETKLARSKKEAISLAREVGFPVGLKIASRDIVHKSDTGGVKLGLRNTAQISKAFNEICLAAKQAYPQANIEGVSVQRMAPPGVEVIIGMTKDPQFGPVLMFGLGGIFVEVLKDVSFRIVPVTRRDAKEMIREIKGYQLLEGYRGQEPANIPILEEMITKISDFVEKNLWIKELDLNPIFAYRDSALVVDARIILEPS